MKAKYGAYLAAIYQRCLSNRLCVGCVLVQFIIGLSAIKESRLLEDILTSRAENDCSIRCLKLAISGRRRLEGKCERRHRQDEDKS
ncbi:hypothetical protein NA56DRAFT_338758 [Hyaloscypha hepaticicola]|uniref:Uncharacterized protein n=1 Tax=Hyaloscypha hepaticicola TaxID=2082293 RepID=A0A2J6QIT7_9HELO|nr:hypothetical protein NA56DRAFT_338758 [Hyaloscypha hepaticicola]